MTQLEADGHAYLSTSCYHREHDYCQATEIRDDYGQVALSKRPAQCKFCGAPCRCWCHELGGDGDG